MDSPVAPCRRRTSAQSSSFLLKGRRTALQGVVGCWLGAALLLATVVPSRWGCHSPLFHFFPTAEAYPVIAHLDEASDLCFRFNVRGHDDAHMIVVTLPNEDMYPDKAANAAELETFMVQQMYEISQKKSKKMGLANKLADAPEALARKQSDFFQHHQSHDSPLTVRITDNPASPTPTYKGIFHAKYFSPLVVNHLKRFLKGGGGLHGHIHAAASEHRGDEENLEGYGLCFKNVHPDQHLHVLFEVVLDSDHVTDPLLALDALNASAAVPKTDFDRQKHLTPLERSLDQSVAAANAVLREMRYMEKREQRMRQTADHINARVRYFSYLSIGVLLVVTYVQVGYLKRYFHKKKLL